MRYKHLTRANVDISEFTVGTWGMSGTNNFGYFDRQGAIDTIRAAIDNGVNHIDTAPAYGNGYSEQLVGEAIQGYDRSKLIISTKFGIPRNILAFGRDASFKNIMREIASSLQNLKTDYIDFYFVHWPDPHTPIAETMCALNLLKDMGKIKHIGVSNFSIEQVEEAEKFGVVAVQQNQYSMVNREKQELMDWGYERGIDSFTYGSLGSGILSGAYRELPNFAKGDTRTTFYDYFKEPKFSKIQRLLSVMDKVAEKHNVPVAQVAINWSVQQPSVGTALIGVLKPQEAIENCGAFNWMLDDEDIALLNKTIEVEGI